MAEDTNKMGDQPNSSTSDDDNDDDEGTGTTIEANDEVRKLAAQIAAQDLKEIKEKLNKAFSRAEKAERDLAREKEEKRKAEIKALEDSGKTEEALRAKMSDMEAELEALRRNNTELTRDRRVEAALLNIEDRAFRNAKSKEMAFRDIVGQLVQKEEGWFHKSGIPIEDFVKLFINDAENEFLFRPIENRGTGASSRSGTADGGPDLSKGVRSVPTQQLLQLAGQGKLGKPKSY